MPTVTILTINQRTEDGAISINTSLPNPLIVLDLLVTVQKQYIAQAAQVMELKPEAKLITGEQGKNIIT